MGIDRRGQIVVVVREVDKESESSEELSYCPTLLDVGKCENNRKEVESAPHPSRLAEGTLYTDQYSGLREVVARRSSGGTVREKLVGAVEYFRMELVDRETRNGVGSLEAGSIEE